MPSSEIVAVIDVGSNSIKLLVARSGNTPDSVETLFTETIETRISAGISQARPCLTETAMQAGCQTITELVGLAHNFQPNSLRIVATSAVRDATNAPQFIALIYQATGIELQILSGTEEATYICKGLACDPQIGGSSRFIQMDIGGGSLELIRFQQGTIVQALSLQLGAVRLTERFIHERDAALSNQTVAAITAHVQQQLTDSGFSFAEDAGPMIVTGGAFTVTRAILAAQAGMTIDARTPKLLLPEITALKDKLIHLPLHDRMTVPQLPVSRADIIPAALITIDTVLNVAQRSSVTHSFYNLRYGIAAELLGR
jgi:exopolyphosphatase/guanosine-5'-triphosphate,3'-diphosphate pyrophosphatase